MVISDNGASAEGGPTGTTNEAQFFNNAQEPLEDSLAVIDEIGGPNHFNHYPWGWTWAGNTPFRRWKRETYRGGASDPFIVSLAAGHQGPRARSAPSTRTSSTWSPRCWTCSASSRPPRSAASPSHRSRASASPTPSTTPTPPSNHHTQYFEMLGHRSIYHDGWRAVCPWPGPSFTEAGVGFGQPISADTLSELDADGWELYHVAEDFAETHNVAGEHRDKLIALIGMWYAEAGKYGVLPVDGSGVARLLAEKPLVALPRDRYVYMPNTQSIPFFAGPRVLNRPHSITASVELPEGGAEGVLLSQGSAAGGYSLFIKDRRLHYVHNYVGRQPAQGLLTRPGPAGRARAALRVRADRRAGPGQRPRGAGPAPALRRRRARRRRGGPGDHAVHPQPRRPHLRRQPRLPGDPGLPARRSGSPARCTRSPSTSPAS